MDPLAALRYEGIDHRFGHFAWERTRLACASPLAHASRVRSQAETMIKAGMNSIDYQST